MDIFRVSCLGVARDSWRTNRRWFWGTYRLGSWWLHTSDKVEVGEMLADKPVLKIGRKRYGGLAAVSSPTGWYVVVSVDSHLVAYKFDVACAVVLGVFDVGWGEYPRMFWNNDINKGLLAYERGGRVVGRYATNWLEFGNELSLELFTIDTVLGNSFIGLWEGAPTLFEWLEIYRQLNEMNVGDNINYLLE